MLLFDTQALLWFADDRHDLGKNARRQITSASDARFSPVSMAEIAIKTMTGRVRVPPDLADALAEHGVRELPYRTDAAVAIERFSLLNGTDPFDRMLLAQAAAERADFLTADRRLLSLGLDWVFDARA